MIELAPMQVRLTSIEGVGEVIFVLIDKNLYDHKNLLDHWNVIIIHSTRWLGKTFPPGSSSALDAKWLQTNTVVIA